jgi:hypothetical protein
MRINGKRCHQGGCGFGSCPAILRLSFGFNLGFTARGFSAIAGAATGDSSDAKATGLAITIMLATVCGGSDRGSLNAATKLKPETGAGRGSGLGIFARVVILVAPVELWSTRVT